LDHVWAGDVERLDIQIAPGSFDAIVCADVLEHLREPGRLLEQAREWLTLNGTGETGMRLDHRSRAVPRILGPSVAIAIIAKIGGIRN
jgi:Methyltransferase domain